MLTAEERATRKRERLLAKSREYQTGTYIRKFVAPVFQRMIRAEAGARPNQPAMIDGVYSATWTTPSGVACCVTCGKSAWWTTDKKAGLQGLDAGHYLAGRGNAILFEETNCHPQCSYCNERLCGNQGAYLIYMFSRYGQAEIERLLELKHGPAKQFTREELVDMRIAYQARLDKAMEVMK